MKTATPEVRIDIFPDWEKDAQLVRTRSRFGPGYFEVRSYIDSDLPLPLSALEITNLTNAHWAALAAAYCPERAPSTPAFERGPR